VLSLARMYDDKDPLTMVEAVSELHRRGQPVELTAIGAGPLRAAVQERASSAGVPATFIEHVPHDELPAHYRAADVLVLTTTEIGEGWNQATLEAMACGLPVVATDVRGVRDSAGGAALLVPPRTPTAVADAVQHLTADPERWRRQRDRGLERVKDLTWDGIARRLEGLYQVTREPAPR
jgi:glycosyltransferase involved in cell wall biosynthesis